MFFGTDPNNDDSDGDGVSDGDEALFFKTDPAVPNEFDGPAFVDADGDNVPDLIEIRELGTDPANPDTDGDGLDDGGEIFHGTNPLVKDTDKDGLEDGAELFQFDTDPRRRDTDGDGIPDGAEVLVHQTDPNDPDTDWSLPQNGEWAAGIVKRWQSRCGDDAAEVPLVLEGKEIPSGRQQKESMDPSRPGTVVARYQLAAEADVDRAVACARADADGWRRRSARERTEILYCVAEQISTARSELMGSMLAEGGKTLTESDVEVSEAVDFCRFYSRSAEYFYELPGIEARGKGVVVVVSPWNFPLAIPCGGVAAAIRLWRRPTL
ncbi:MAG: aldehyde dehydrogenase family protein [Planctomycetes bacterium]|nr:aldehyde dehydrogenase family protein [Planctomycetota bacterium]